MNEIPKIKTPFGWFVKTSVMDQVEKRLKDLEEDIKVEREIRRKRELETVEVKRERDERFTVDDLRKAGKMCEWMPQSMRILEEQLLKEKESGENGKR